MRKYRADVFALIAYILLAIVLTYPLVLRFATHVAGDGSDDPALAWNLWWVPHAILNLQSPIYTDYMFYPIGLNLAFYTLTYLNAFLSIPFQFAFNLVIAANANLLLSFALSGFGAYLLAKYLFRGSGFRFQEMRLETLNLKLAAFVAGALYAFSSNKMLYASLGQFNIASSHWIPFYVLFLLKLTRARISIYYGFLLGLILLFQSLSEFIHASFLIIFTALYLVYWFVANHRPLSAAYRLLPAFATAALVFLLPMLPILAAMIRDMLTEGDFIQSGLGFADVFSSDALGFFVPSHLHPIFGGLEAQFHFAYTNFAYLGLIALALAALALWKVPPARIWGLFGAIFVLITLGPELRVNGASFDLPLPFDLLLEIPFIKGNRYPSRWSVMVTLALAVLVGYGVVWLLERLSRTTHYATSFATLRTVRFTFYVSRVAIFILLTSALLFEHLSVPLPISNLQTPTVYQTIARDKGDFAVLEIPLAWRNGFRMTGTLEQAMMFAQWYQTKHRRPILGGNTSRSPELKFQYFTEAPVINSLIAVETGHTLNDARLQADKALAPAVLSFFGVRYAVWHSPRNPDNRAALDAARAYVEQVLPITKFYDETDETGHTVAYRVNETGIASPTAIHAGEPLTRLHFAEGWGMLSDGAVWATRREAKLFMRLDRVTGEQTLSFRAYAPMSNQRVAVSVNGHAAGAVQLRQGWGEYSARVPRSVPVLSGVEGWRAGVNEIILQFDALVPVASVRAGDYAIGMTGIAAPVSIVVSSAGNEVGDFAHVYVNGVDAAPNARGYNVVVINERTGAVEASAAFDTFASEKESARLAQFIAEIPNGKIVAVAVRDEASRFLTEDAVNALRPIGAERDLRGKFRWSHAIIGVKGAASGSAWEAAFETLPAQLVVGISATEPNVAAAVEWVKVEAR
jgi:hypothetical protein